MSEQRGGELGIWMIALISWCIVKRGISEFISSGARVSEHSATQALLRN